MTAPFPFVQKTKVSSAVAYRTPLAEIVCARSNVRPSDSTMRALPPGTGGSDSAGFVQIIRGRVDDASGLKALMTDAEMLHQMRPEIIGATLAVEDDGTFTETIAFTDETAAREGESRMSDQMPAETRRVLESAMAGATFWDLHRPWFESP